MPHSSIYPLTYSQEVYTAVGRNTINSRGPEHFVELMNQSNVLNFELIAGNDARSTAFIMHMDALADKCNHDIKGHQTMMIAAKIALEIRDG